MTDPKTSAKELAVRVEEATAIMQAKYWETFTQGPGKDVLENLMHTFSPSTSCFGSTNPDYNPIKAAKIDGQGDIVRHICAQIDAHELKLRSQ